MKRKILFFSLFIVLCKLSFSQGISLQEYFDQNANTLFNEIYNDRLKEGELSFIEGTPYYDEEFSESTIYVKDADKPVFGEIRLNIYQNVFEVMHNGQKVTFLPMLVDSIIYLNDTFLYKKGRFNNSDPEMLILQKIYKGNGGGLYLYRKAKFNQPQAAKGYQDAIPPNYETLDPIYFIEINGKLIQFYRFSKLYKEFPKNKNQLKKFVKTNKIDKNKPEHLVKLVKYMEEVI